MAAGKTKTAEQKERERNKRLQDNYRWSLERRNRLSDFQGRKCAICGRLENPEHPLNTDHFHFKIVTQRLSKSFWPLGGLKWEARTTINDFQIHRMGRTKKEAIERLKDTALPRSVRGLLCPGRRGCNRRLGWVDDSKWLEAANRYLKNPPALSFDKPQNL